VASTSTCLDSTLHPPCTGVVTGLSPGLHGFHIHNSADFSDGCASTGGHWNPNTTTHGAPDNADTNKHLGDFGNIEADENGVAVFNVTIANDLYADLFETEVPMARSFVVHADEDDLGLGGNNGSLATGNAGGRLRCGEIFKFSPLYAMANLTAGPANVTVAALMMQESPSSLTVMTLASGIGAEATHGWHIHSNAASDTLGCGANVTGGHYNPIGSTHSNPTEPLTARHMGDFGNIESDASGMVNSSITVQNVYLWGAYSVMDRAWVLHNGTDDLGLGGDNGSLATGNAGARIKCGNIMATTMEEIMDISMPKMPNVTLPGISDDPDSGAARYGSLLSVLLVALALALGF